jgi:hypothetical protein
MSISTPNLTSPLINEVVLNILCPKIYVIQKRTASTLNYDFRLDIAGTDEHASPTRDICSNLNRLSPGL